MPVEGRDLSSRQTQYVVKDMEIGKPINSDKCSEAADGVARESEGVKSCPRAGCGRSASPVVCPVKAGMFRRRQDCRGRSQSPVVWIAEVMETETLKPIDEVSPGEATSHRAVTKVNALWPRKGVSPRAEPSTGGRRPHEQPKTDRYGCSPRRGGSDSTVTRTCQATGEALFVPARNRRSKVGRITGETGKSARDERVSDGSVVAMKRSNVRGAKGPCHLQSLQHKGRQGRDDKGVRRFAGPEAEDIRQGEG